jgi:hypothetical protein
MMKNIVSCYHYHRSIRLFLWIRVRERPHRRRF